MPISWNTVNFKFRLIFATNTRILVIIYWERPFIWCFLGKPIDPYQQMIQRKRKTILCLSVAKIKQNLKITVSRNGHRIKITFSSAEDALLNDVKKMTLLDRKILKICHSAFLGTPGVIKLQTSTQRSKSCIRPHLFCSSWMALLWPCHHWPGHLVHTQSNGLSIVIFIFLKIRTKLILFVSPGSLESP